MNNILKSKILMVDDNDEIRNLLFNLLKKEGYQSLMTAKNCKEATNCFQNYVPDIVILDIMLPDGDGFSLMRAFRLISDAPVLFLSAKDEDNDRLLGLGLGADDYITKPFLPTELLLRLSAILKRTYLPLHNITTQTLTLGIRNINFSSGVVTTPTQTIALTAKELTLLKKLNDNRGNIVTFDSLSDAVWGENYYGYENTLMVHIRRLREKIEDMPSEPKWLLTFRGLGYKLMKGD
ncbi:response regulator transcription factor [Anaerosacchariphilus polymeriproducens]|uniref:Stage 0 sporulation protein A homolog n=1 Tax=Anaerosacchariphilus polymeriproducens TaxID=1812858 RepID=A0A371AWJ9_9FIRM|nr:response regulator transcription factor [Anaerosacchariphilus polymeriproducens]RDU23909.1 DNA-binding response regulator [Anaerosacchariphilus polymeriproducens]